MKSREEILKEIEDLAGCKVNDAVRLAFLGEEELAGDLDGLELSAITELKRSGSGTVEMKFIDRLAALQWLLERTGAEDPQALQLYEALEEGTKSDAEREARSGTEREG